MRKIRQVLGRAWIGGARRAEATPQWLFDDSSPKDGRANYLRFRIAPNPQIALAARVKHVLAATLFAHELATVRDHGSARFFDHDRWGILLTGVGLYPSDDSSCGKVLPGLLRRPDELFGATQ